MAKKEKKEAVEAAVEQAVETQAQPTNGRMTFKAPENLTKEQVFAIQTLISSVEMAQAHGGVYTIPMAASINQAIQVFIKSDKSQE